MRIEREQSRIFSVYLPSSLYQKVLDKAGKGSVSTFIKKVLEKELISEEQQRKHEFQKKLIADYQSVAKSKNMQKEAEIWDETLNDTLKKDE